MARIRHIALLTKDTEKLAEFYKTSFGMGVRLSNLDNLIAKTTFAEITRSLE